MRQARALIASLCCVAIAACAAQGATAEPVALPERGELVWSADHEMGDLGQWTSGQGSAVFNTGNAEATVERVAFARSGDHALLLRIDVGDGSVAAARVFRWRENPVAAYYGAWLYLPTRYDAHAWWNVMQVKSPDAGGVSRPTWVVNVTTDADGAMRLYLWDALREVAYPVEAARTARDVAVGRWVHVELYVERAVGPTGRVALLLDGALLYDVRNVRTSLGDTVHFSVNNYSAGVTPSEVLVYVDDATIHLAKQGGDDAD